MATDWKKLASEAANETDKYFADKIASLTRLSSKEIEDVVKKTGISNADLVSALKEVKDATKENQAKVEALKKINKGLETIVLIASKII